MHTVEIRVRSTLQGVAVRVKSFSYLTKVPMLYKLPFIKWNITVHLKYFLSLYFCRHVENTFICSHTNNSHS